jgi:hypothetical protein
MEETDTTEQTGILSKNHAICNMCPSVEAVGLGEIVAVQLNYAGVTL